MFGRFFSLGFLFLVGFESVFSWFSISLSLFFNRCLVGVVLGV